MSTDVTKATCPVDFHSLGEHLRELILEDLKIWDAVTEMAKWDLAQRGITENVDEKQYAELVCMGQTRYYAMLLSESVSHWLG